MSLLSRTRISTPKEKEQTHGTPLPNTDSQEDEDEDDEIENGDEEEEVENGGVESEKSRQQLRMNYRKLIVDANENRDSFSSQQLVTVINKADKLFKEVHHTREATLDYEFSDLTMQIAVNNANKLTTGFKGYSIDEYVTKMNTQSKEAKFYDTFIKEFVICETPSRVFLYGGLDVKQKEKIIREKRAKDVLQEKVNPLNVIKDKKEELDMTKRVKSIYQKLEDKQGETEAEKNVDFWPFVNNSNSFATTVENLFHFSFLVHEGNAAIEKGDEISVTTATPPKKQGVAPENIKNQQCVIRLDYKLWEENNKKSQESQKKASPQKRQKKLTET
jgi:hypothetical protein